jgi:ABC-type sugar transport system ATPase subunit
MHMISESQKRALTEVLCAASDMLDLMDEAPPDVWDEEWREAVRESIDRMGWLIKSHHIYVTSKKED